MIFKCISIATESLQYKKNDKVYSQFYSICSLLKKSLDVPDFVRSYLDKHQVHFLSLFLSYKKRNETPFRSRYMALFERLQDATQSTRSYLKRTDLSKYKRFKRSHFLLDFCRTVIPFVSHPLIHHFSRDPAKRLVLDSMYDAFTMLVMMNTIIDDAADVIGDFDLIDRLGYIHRESDHRILTDGLYPIEYRDLVLGACDMWSFALDTLQDYCHIPNIRSHNGFKEDVYPELDRIIMCMRYSVVRSDMDLGDFEQALFHYEIGMIIHLFWAIERWVMIENGWVNPDLIFFDQLDPMGRLYDALLFSNSVCACIANDFATFDRELDVECHTNSAVHLCQDLICQFGLGIDLKSWILTYSNSDNDTERQSMKHKILTLFSILDVHGRLFGCFEEYLHYIDTISDDFYSCNHPYAQLFAMGTEQLVQGNVDLLVMYLMMRFVKGAV